MFKNGKVEGYEDFVALAALVWQFGHLVKTLNGVEGYVKFSLSLSLF